MFCVDHVGPTHTAIREHVSYVINFKIHNNVEDIADMKTDAYPELVNLNK